MNKKPDVERKLIRPKTPRHNGEAERIHGNDQERFYNHLHFYSLDDLNLQLRRYLTRSNDIPTKVLGWDAPKERQMPYIPPSVFPKAINLYILGYYRQSPPFYHK